MPVFACRLYPKSSANFITPDVRRQLDRFTLKPAIGSTEFVISRDGFEMFISNPGKNDTDFLYEDEDAIILLCGEARLLGKPVNIRAGDIKPLVMKKSAFSLGGYYLVFAYFKAEKQAMVWNTVARTVPGYFADQDGSVIFSNRSVLASILCERGTPNLNPRAFVPFGLIGFHPSENSPFSGVSVMPANSYGVMKSGRISFEDIDDTMALFSSGTATDDIFDEVAHVLSCAAAPINGGNIRVGLTGGRDSRLLASALRASGAEFTAYTNGDSKHPDSTIAALVSEALNIPHEALGSATVQFGSERVDPRRNANTTLFGSDWHVFGYDRLGAQPKRFIAHEVYGGAGGEMLRGGYPQVHVNASTGRGRKYLNRLWNTHGLISNRVCEWVEHERERAASQIAGLRDIDALDAIYLLYRSGRWGSATYMASRGSIRRAPFMDNELLKLVYSLPGEIRSGQYLYYEILRRYNSELVRIPFFAKTYSFVRNPIPAYASVAETLPQPVPAKDKSKALFNWRFEFRSKLGEIIANEISIGLDRGLDQIFDPNKTREFINQAVEKSEDRMTGRSLWGLFSASLALEVSAPDRFGGEQEIDIPIRESVHF